MFRSPILLSVKWSFDNKFKIFYSAQNYCCLSFSLQACASLLTFCIFLSIDQIKSSSVFDGAHHSSSVYHLDVIVFIRSSVIRDGNAWLVKSNKHSCFEQPFLFFSLSVAVVLLNFHRTYILKRPSYEFRCTHYERNKLSVNALVTHPTCAAGQIYCFFCFRNHLYV